MILHRLVQLSRSMQLGDLLNNFIAQQRKIDCAQEVFA